MPILYLGHDLGVDRVATAAVLDTGLEVCKRFSVKTEASPTPSAPR